MKMSLHSTNNLVVLKDLPPGFASAQHVIGIGILWLKHTRIPRSESKYSGCYECVWLGNDIQLNDVIIQFDKKRSSKWLYVTIGV